MPDTPNSQAVISPGIAVVDSDACKDCGMCCMAFIVVDRDAYMESIFAGKRERRWVDEDLIPLTEQQVLALGILPERVVLETIRNGGTYYTCRLFDLGTRRCTDFNNRPLTCRGYPARDATIPWVGGCRLYEVKYGRHYQ